MPVIGISGSYGGLNLGDEAILTCVIEELRASVPGAEIVVFARDAEHTREHHDVERAVRARGALLETVTPEVERLDLLILGGGGILYEKESHQYLREVKLAHELGIPTATYAIGVGPLGGSEERSVVKEALNRMDLVTVRESGAKRLLEEIGVARDIVVTADPALLLGPEPFTSQMLEREGVSKDGHLIGISVREPGDAAPNLNEDAYHALLADAADFMVARFDAQVVFVPMERQDIRHAHQVMAHMLAAERAAVLRGEYGPGQILGLMEHLDMAVGMRMHFLIFAALAAVPLVPLPYAPKVAAFLESLDMPIPSALDQEGAGPLLAHVDRLWDERRHQQELLRERVPALRDRARHTTRLTVGLLDASVQQVGPAAGSTTIR